MKSQPELIEQERRRFLSECWKDSEVPSEEAWQRHLRGAACDYVWQAHSLLAHATDPEMSLEADREAADKIIGMVKEAPFRLPPTPWVHDDVWSAYLAGDDVGIGLEMEMRRDELQEMRYSDYLATPEWAEQRRGALRRAGRSCETCGGAEHLHVHHRTYGRRGEEEVDDLIVLCEDCHLAVHTHGGSQRPRGLRKDLGPV